jgi:hypothetical protein
MRTIHKITLLLFCLSLFSRLPAQVTIGADEAPAEGALLQLKDLLNVTTGAKNANKGLLMPRVQLVSSTGLDPMFPGATSNEKIEHAGLIVYNLTEDDNLHLKKGIMVWNGEMWNHIKSKEITSSLETEIKKTLYTSNVGAIEANSVSLGSIEATLSSYPGYSYSAYPKFKLTVDPGGSNTKKFHWQIGQYWHGSGYSYDVNTMSFTPSNYAYQHLADGSQMAPKERNEVWMFEEGSNDIIHIQFITLGEEVQGASNIFAVLVERF